MSSTPQLPNWFPESVDPQRANICAHTMMEVARQSGFSRETYAVAISQLAEALAGHEGADDIEPLVLKFVGDRLRATSDAIDKSAN